MLCMTYFDYSFFAYIVYDIKSDLKKFYILYNIFHSLQFKTNVSPNWCVWSCWSSHTHEEEENRRKNNTLAYDPKKEKLLPYSPLYVNHLVEYTKKTRPQGLNTESVTEYKDFVLFETKPKNMSMLCMKFCLCCV